ncbi:MAG: hypothetical protein HY238_12080, partial [Acidobacteria bacterium]|nr:hypothetical protein [Acidobacteriota bacterium]
MADVIHEARQGRLVVLEGMGAPVEKSRSLPSRLWVTLGGEGQPASEVEQGAPPGTVVVLKGPGALGTPRRPTRVREWLEEIRQWRTVAGVGELPPWLAPLAHVTLNEEQVDAVVAEARGVQPEPLPPVPGVPSHWGLRGLALAGVLAAGSWLWLWNTHGEATNWRWLQLVPGALTILALAAAAFPWLRDVAAGREMPVTGSYARALARWSRLPRAATAIFLLLCAALAAGWLRGRYVPSTFLVVYEAAGVIADGRDLGACKAEEPCTLIVPRNAHLHFEGAEGACDVALEAGPGLIVIDMQNEACEPYPGTETETSPRG